MLVDSGPLVALFSAADHWHVRVLEWLEAHPRAFNLADASVAEAAVRLKLRHILSIDTDFDVYRDRSGRPLVNLLLQQ